MNEIKTFKELHELWQYHKMMNLDFRGMHGKQYGIAQKLKMDLGAITIGKAMLNHTTETWCAIVENDELVDYTYTFNELVKIIKESKTDVILQFGYNQYEKGDRSDYEEDTTGNRIIFKKKLKKLEKVGK